MSDDFNLEMLDDGAPDAAPLTSLRLGPGVYEDVPIADYVADPCAEPSLRSSDLRRILRFTPSHVRAHHPRLSEKPEWAVRKATKKMDAGSIVHALVLGHGAEFTVIDPTTYKTKAGEPAKGETAEYRADVEAAKAKGLLVLKPKTNEAVQRTAYALKEQLPEVLADEALIEHTLVWEEQTAHGPVLCRTRPDLMILAASGLCVEIKNTEVELSDDGVERLLSANDGAYFMQAAWQLRGIAANFSKYAGRVEHRFYFGELLYPNVVAPVMTSRLALEQADRRCRRAVEKYALLRADGLMEQSWQPRIGTLSTWLEKEWVADEEEDLGATPETFV